MKAFKEKKGLGLAAKFILSITLLLITEIAVLSIYILDHERQILYDTLQEKGLALANNLAYNSQYGMLTANERILSNLVEGVIKQPDVAYCIIEDLNGNMLVSKQNKPEFRVPREIVRAAQESQESISQYFELPSGRDYYEISAPVTAEVRAATGDEEVLFQDRQASVKEKQGVVRIGISLERVDIAFKQAQEIIFSIGIAVTLLAIIVGIFLTHMVLAPVKQLVNATQIVAGGNLGHKVSVKASDEIGLLARSFNQMIETLRKTMTSIDRLNNEIAERRKVEEELRQDREYVASILETANQAFVGSDSEGLITNWNRCAEKTFGWLSKEVVGRRLSDVIFPRSVRADYERDIKHFLATGEGAFLNKTQESMGLHRGCRPFPIEMTIWHHKIGQQRHFFAFISDITERRRSEKLIFQKVEELNRSNRELEEFAYIASHDLQEPLRKVKTFGDRLIQKYKDVLEEQGRDYLMRMESAINRMQTLINDLLTYSRVTSRAQPFTLIDLNGILHEVLSDLEIKTEETNAQIHVDDLPAIEADPVQMRQLFQNLIGNALKFCKPEVPPCVEIRRVVDVPREEDTDDAPGIDKETCIIRVIDNGIGFEEKYKKQIFRVFQRLHGRKEYTGTGIGLAVCRKIVIRHGGLIEAESVPEKGSTFTIILPLRQSKKEEQKEA
ncbi:MAG: PAS domain S-box protein [Candidatus Omnitrophica bacterium]|nr:PAS domain S-box protein [Candidatus Omnitrophota bacterium]